MVRHVGGVTLLRISLASLVVFIITLAISIYLDKRQELTKPVIQAIIATLIFGAGFILLMRNK